MRSADEIATIRALGSEGRTASEVARLTGIPRSTVRGWLGRSVAGRGPAAQDQDAEPDVEARGASYVYLLGLYLGDGCISSHERGVYRLRLFLDVRYPGIVSSAVAAITETAPGKRVNVRPVFGTYRPRDTPSHVQVSAYAKRWPCLFPQHGPGRKHTRTVELVSWQHDLVARSPGALLRGLIHSDGCRFINTGRNWRAPRYSFRNRSAGIRRIFCDACDLYGVKWTTARDTVYVSRVADVARLDVIIGPKA